MALTYTFIAKGSTTGNATIFEFTNIPQTYDDLVIHLNGRAPESGNYSTVNIEYNGGTSNAAKGANLFQLGSVNVAGGNVATTTTTQYGFGYLGGDFQWGCATFNLINYTGTERGLHGTSSSGRASSQIYGQAFSAIITSGTAITSLRIYNAVPQNWVSGSTAYLYGVKRA